MSLFVTKEEGNTIVFHFWKNLRYVDRMFISLTAIIVGLIVQFIMLQAFPGIFIVIAGNFLLLTKGFNNKVDLGKYSAEADWEKTDEETVNKILTINKSVKKWDISFVDISNALGGFMFFLILFVILMAGFVNLANYVYSGFRAIIFNAIVLFLPYWITGIRKIMTTPTLVLKVNTIFDLTRFAKTQFPQHLPDYYLLLKGETSKMPSDIKFKINIQNQTSEFLGLYGQLVLNNVNGSSFPYFYMVLVASKKFNLSQKTSDYTPATNIIKEFKSQEDVDILIIRQYTTSTGGYHTNSNTMRQIISDGISVSENAVNNLLK